MDENEHGKTPSIPETAGDPASPALPPASPAETGEPAIEAKAELNQHRVSAARAHAERHGGRSARAGGAEDRSGPQPRRNTMR